jgi:hypothetical protein
MINIAFDEATQKVIKDATKHTDAVSTTLYYSQVLKHLLYLMANHYLITTFVVLLIVLKQLIKPSQAHDIYLTKEQHLQGKVDWLIKDLEAWDVMCEWWASAEFRAISEQNQHNRQNKAMVHHYGAYDHIRNTQSGMTHSFSLSVCFLY